MGGFRGLNAKNVGIDGKDVFCEGLEVMVNVLWVGDESIRDGGRAADGIRSGGGRNLIGRRTESDRTADGIWSGGGRCPTQSARKKGSDYGVFWIISVTLQSCIYINVYRNVNVYIV